MNRVKLYCECGRVHVVAPTMAGTRIACECQTVITVPSLAQLRQLGPASQLKKQFESKAYWSERGCFVCGEQRNADAHLVLEYERAQYAVVGGEFHPVSFLSLLAFPLFGVFGWARSRTEQVRVKDSVFDTIPIKLCVGCVNVDGLESLCASRLTQGEIGRDLLLEFPHLQVRQVVFE